MERYLGSGSVTYPPPNRILEIPYSLTRSPRTGWSLKTQVIYVFEKPIIRYDLVVGCIRPGRVAVNQLDKAFRGCRPFVGDGALLGGGSFYLYIYMYLYFFLMWFLFYFIMDFLYVHLFFFPLLFRLIRSLLCIYTYVFPRCDFTCYRL